MAFPDVFCTVSPPSPQPEMAIPQNREAAQHLKVGPVASRNRLSLPQQMSEASDTFQIYPIEGRTQGQSRVEKKSRVAVLRETKSFKMNSLSPQCGISQNPRVFAPRVPSIPSGGPQQKLRLTPLGNPHDIGRPFMGHGGTQGDDQQTRALRQLNSKYLRMAQEVSRSAELNTQATHKLLLDVFGDLILVAPEVKPLFQALSDAVKTLVLPQGPQPVARAFSGVVLSHVEALRKAFKRQFGGSLELPLVRPDSRKAQEKRKLNANVKELSRTLPFESRMSPGPQKQSKPVASTFGMSSLSPTRQKPVIPHLNMDIVHKRAECYF